MNLDNVVMFEHLLNVNISQGQAVYKTAIERVVDNQRDK